MKQKNKILLRGNAVTLLSFLCALNFNPCVEVTHEDVFGFENVTGIDLSSYCVEDVKSNAIEGHTLVLVKDYNDVYRYYDFDYNEDDEEYFNLLEC